MKIDVKHVAKLANLTLSCEEEEKFAQQLSDVIEHVNELRALDTENVIPTTQATNLENVMRDDVTLPSFSQEKALSQATKTHNGLFQVKGILDNE